MLTGGAARWTWLALAGAVLGSGALFAGQDEGPFASWVSVVILTATVGGALVLLATRSWSRAPPDRRWLLLVLVAGLAFRLAVLPASRDLSDDAYRYVWDGKVLAHGLNPYRHAPDEAAVARLRVHAIDDRINHPWVRTCYPPVAQALFTGAYLLSPGRLTGFQLLCLAAELATWLLLLGELRRRSLPPSRLLLVAWSPLLVYQGYLPGHLDLLGLPFLTLFLIDTGRGRAWRAGLWLGLAVLIKPLPLIFLPAAGRELGWRGTGRCCLALAAVSGLAYLPFLTAGWQLFSSTWLMAVAWSFNGSLAAGLERLLPLTTAHLVATVLLALLLAAGTWRGRDLLARLLLAQAAFVVCTPTLFPWYLIGMLPLLALRPEPALLALAVLAPLADEVVVGFHASGLWEPAAWPRLAQYVPFYGLLAWGAWRGRGMFRPPTGSAPRGAAPDVA